MTSEIKKSYYLRRKEQDPEWIDRKNARRRKSGRVKTKKEKAQNKILSLAHYHRTKYDPVIYIHKVVRARAIQKKYKFDLTEEYLAELIRPMICNVTGIKLLWDPKIKRNPRSISLDRIDSSKGYIKGNVQIVALIYNMAKQDWEYEDIMELLVKPLMTRRDK